MIRYRLVCTCDHEFDQWFDTMADYDVQKDGATLACPKCGGVEVSKAIMAPRLAGSGGTVGTTSDPAPACGTGGCGGGMCPAMQ